jgi:hypothetical protein
MSLHHDNPPERAGEVSEELLRKVEKMLASPYSAHAKSLIALVVGSDVLKAEAGPSGFALFLSDGRWVLCALRDNEWRWKIGSEEIGETDRLLMHSDAYGDASAPLTENVPYAEQGCDFIGEVSKAIGKRIVGISIGNSCFNFCFDGGRELDVTLRRDTHGKLAYRVYWEQW